MESYYGQSCSVHYLLEVKTSKIIPVQESFTTTLRLLYRGSLYLIFLLGWGEVVFREGNIAPLANIVQHCTDSNNSAHFDWRRNSYFRVQNMEASLQLPDAPLDYTACNLVCPEM